MQKTHCEYQYDINAWVIKDLHICTTDVLNAMKNRGWHYTVYDKRYLVAWRNDSFNVDEKTTELSEILQSK